MKQLSPAAQLAPLVPPRCDSCGEATRLVGLEPVATGGEADLCTYECNSCTHVQTRVFLRVKRRARQ